MDKASQNLANKIESLLHVSTIVTHAIGLLVLLSRPWMVPLVKVMKS